MGNTPLWSPQLGDVSFPMTPTSIDGMVIGGTTPAAGTFTTVAVKGLLHNSVANPISIAATTDTFAGAVALTAQINVIGTVAVGASTAAPAALPSVVVASGAVISVFNQTTRSVAVWPQPLDIIDVVATSGPVIVGIGNRCNFIPVGTTHWISAQMGTTSA